MSKPVFPWGMAHADRTEPVCGAKIAKHKDRQALRKERALRHMVHRHGWRARPTEQKAA